MPWSNQTGGNGGWRGSGGGGGGGGGPWGSGPQQSGPNPPDLEELLRRGQDRLRSALPGGSLGGKGVFLVLALLLAGWAATGIYRVQVDQLGVVLRFGEHVRTEPPGLHYHLPYPIETVATPSVTRVNRIDVGLRLGDDPRRTVGLREVPEEALMLTGDENIVDINFSVFWLINDAANFLFNIQNPEGTVKAVAESAMREVVGRSNLQPILTQARQTTEQGVHDLIQRTLNDYGSGIQVTQVQLQKVDPPSQVIDAFRDVQAARADQERIRNEAQAYANRVIPEARGQAAQITQAAEAYRQQTVAEATGQADRFVSVYEQYAQAPDVTRQRIFLETMERVFGGMEKVIIDSGVSNGSNGVVPYLPLNELRGRQQQQQAGGSQRGTGEAQAQQGEQILPGSLLQQSRAQQSRGQQAGAQ